MYRKKEKTLKILSGSFRITDYRNFSADRTANTFDNFFKLLRYFIAIGGLTALTAYMGWHIFDDNNTATHIGCKSRKALLYTAFAHKTSHCTGPVLHSRAISSMVIQ